MHAPTQPASTKSSISLLFGRQITEKNTPINMNFQVEVFSQKNQNIRFNLQQMLNVQIKENTLMLEIKAKKGFGVELADKIMDFLKGNQVYQESNKKNILEVKAVGKSEICYIFIQSKKIEQSLKELIKTISQIEKQQSEQQSPIKLQIKSQNNGAQIRNFLEKQGAMRAFLDSLSIQLSFNKTKIVDKILQKLSKQTQIPLYMVMLKSFSNMNLKLNFGSSAELDRFQKLRVFGLIEKKTDNIFFAAIKGLYSDEMKLSYFNPVLSFSGNIFVEQLQVFLDALFSEPGQGK